MISGKWLVKARRQHVSLRNGNETNDQRLLMLALRQAQTTTRLKGREVVKAGIRWQVMSCSHVIVDVTFAAFIGTSTADCFLSLSALLHSRWPVFIIWVSASFCKNQRNAIAQVWQAANDDRDSGARFIQLTSRQEASRKNRKQQQPPANTLSTATYHLIVDQLF